KIYVHKLFLPVLVFRRHLDLPFFFSITWEHINIYDYLWGKLRLEYRDNVYSSERMRIFRSFLNFTMEFYTLPWYTMTKIKKEPKKGRKDTCRYYIRAPEAKARQ
ncbi:hypothetical protein, partial [Blautia obeum]|uniref:hypothetical protein n=1 Tax=Blautia obeum TaxID=40520 RepID=UPI001D05E892